MIRFSSLIFCAGVLLAQVLQAQTFDTPARSAIVLDVGTGLTLLEKNADTPLPPASMSKLMTLNMVFEALEDGRLSLDQKLPVSARAQAYKGSTMFLNTMDRVTVEDLIRGVVVLSGNDATVVLAEALSPDGTERGFANFMTQRAKQLGMVNSTFGNSNGWPDPEQRMSVRDLAILAERLVSEFPQYYPYFAETEFPYDNRAPDNRFNRNPLLKLGIGADGLKTGHTQEAGYGLVGSAKRGDRRVIFVISGLDSERARAEESERLNNWAFRQFVEKKVADRNVTITQADVWMGAVAQVGLAPADDVKVLIPALGGDDVSAKVIYRGPLEAPIKAGDQLAELVFSAPGLNDLTFPLVAIENVDRGGFFVRIRSAVKTLLGQTATGQAATAS